jgi:hypothetical protein
MRLVCADDEEQTVGENRAVPGKLPKPTRPEELAAHYDLTISHPEVDAVPYVEFESWLAAEADRLGLTCAVIHDGTVREVIRRLGVGELSIGYHLDYHALWHRPEDAYARLAEAVQDAGGQPVNAPARSRAFTDKAAAHAELLRHELGVPPTLIFRSGTADRPLTAAERRFLRLEEPGARLYIKPANGFGGKGMTCVSGADVGAFVPGLAGARQYDRQDTYLVQREIRAPMMGCDDGVERPAYWRILACLGDLIPFWWSPLERSSGRPSYQRVIPEEIRRHRLQPVLAYARALADLSGLEWFSTELCLSDGPETSRYHVKMNDGRERPVVAIDYLNDQCDVDVQSRWPGAPPDDVVRHVARRFAREAARRRTGAVTSGRVAA